MNEPEIRTVYRVADVTDRRYDCDDPEKLYTDEQIVPVVQEAIPWCLTHDICKMSTVDMCWIGGNVEGNVCVISWGGLDHWWWKDV